MLDYGFNFMNTKIYIDNESTICIVKNLVFHSKTKHIEFRHHFIRDAYEKKLIQVPKIHSDDNVADLLHKAFDVSRIEGYILYLSINDASIGFSKKSSLGTEHVSKHGRKKSKTGTNIEEGDFNKIDDLVDEGVDYVVNEGMSTDKIKVLNAKAEGVSAAGETLSTATLAISTTSVKQVLIKCFENKEAKM
nr:putative ribonuclease H-like domain-containing protein [Tanacetum cinerariifolium]